MEEPKKKSPESRKPLVTVEFQREVDVSNGQGESRMFVKMYFDARDSGLLREMPADLWQLLCCLSTYMDPAGNCFPSQERIAQDLGMARETVNRKLRKLLAWRFDGKPVIRVTPRVRNRKTQRWSNNRYEILPISSLGIFDSNPFSARNTHVTDRSHGDRVTRSSHGDRHTATRPDDHTNEIQSTNKKTFNVERDSETCSDEPREEAPAATDPPRSQRLASEEHRMSRATHLPPNTTVRIDHGLTRVSDSLSGYMDKLPHDELSHGEVTYLVQRIEEATGDHHSRRRFQAIAQHVPKHVIEQVLSSIKSGGSDLRNPGAVFEKLIQVECQALGVELPRARHRPEQTPESSPPGRSDPETADAQQGQPSA